MNEKIDIIKKWIEKADHDLGTAKITFVHAPQFKDTICFHCQQAVEKYIKAHLIFSDIEFQFKHDLIYLLELLATKNEISLDYYDKASYLQDFAVEIRYPNDTEEMNLSEVQIAIDYAADFRLLMLNRMNIDIPFDNV